MSAHVSLLEVHQFVTRGEATVAFEAHVSECAACAARLSTFARRHVTPLAVVSPDEDPRRLAAVVMAFAACLMVMMAQSVRLPRVEGTATPGGVQEVAGLEAPRRIELAWGAPGPVDSGAVDSGVR